MSISIKISEKAKHLLDAIQARITLATGKKYSQQELLDMIIESSGDKKEEIIRRLTKVQPLSKKEIDALKKLSVDWGIHTKEEDIDHKLYGNSKKPALSNIVGLGKSGTKGNAVTLKKRIQKGEL